MDKIFYFLNTDNGEVISMSFIETKEGLKNKDCIRVNDGLALRPLSPRDLGRALNLGMEEEL